MSEMEVTVYYELMAKYVSEIPEDVLALSEPELLALANPTNKMYAVKRSFWNEFLRVQKEGGKISPLKVYNGLVNRTTFNRMISNPARMAWLIAPIVCYETQIAGIMDKAIDRYDDLLNMEITTTRRMKNDDGEMVTVTQTCAKKATVLLATLNSIQDRVKGTAVQRQVNITTSSPKEKKNVIDMNAVDDRLKELETQLGESPLTIDISEVEDEA